MNRGEGSEPCPGAATFFQGIAQGAMPPTSEYIPPSHDDAVAEADADFLRQEMDGKWNEWDAPLGTPPWWKAGVEWVWCVVCAYGERLLSGGYFGDSVRPLMLEFAVEQAGEIHDRKLQYYDLVDRPEKQRGKLNFLEYAKKEITPRISQFDMEVLICLRESASPLSPRQQGAFAQSEPKSESGASVPPDESQPAAVRGNATDRAALLTEFKAKGRSKGIRIADEMVAKAAKPGKWNDRTMVTWWKANNPRCGLPQDKKIRAVLDRDPSSIWPRNIKSKRLPK